MDIYETRRLIGIISDLRVPSNFLTRLLFGNYIASTGSEKITFDVEGRVTGMAMFCSPLSEGRPVKALGYTTKEFTPPYLKSFGSLNPAAVLKRRIGEVLGGDLSAADREKAQLVQFLDQLYRLWYNRLEKMAGEALAGGTNTFVGDGYPSTLVDYGRAAGHTVTLTGGNRWGQSGISPIKNLETWIGTYIAANGHPPTDVVQTPDAWGLFRDDPLFDKQVNKDYARETEGAALDYLGLDDSVQGMLMGTLAGGGGKIRLWQYNQSFTDEAGSAAQVLPNYTVVMGAARPEAQQTLAFGTVLDPNLGFQAENLRDPVTGQRMEIAPSTWLTNNPGRRHVMLQGSVMTALTKPNATFGATVN